MNQTLDLTDTLEQIKAGAKIDGKDGILAPLIKQLTEAALQAELESHLTTEINKNRKNGKSTKTMKSIVGEFELDIPREVAKIAKSNLVNSFIFVSALYANPKSSGEYIRFKGQVEEELKELSFPKLAIMRPSFLIGNRKEKRASETIGIFAFKLLSPLLLGPLKKMKPIHSETVAKTMIRAANENLEKNIFESNEIDELALNQS